MFLQAHLGLQQKGPPLRSAAPVMAKILRLSGLSANGDQRRRAPGESAAGECSRCGGAGPAPGRLIPMAKSDGLGHVKDRQPYFPSRLRGGLGLKTVQVQVAEWTWGNHGVGTQILGFAGVLADHSQGVAFVNGENRKAAATGLPREVHHRRAQRSRSTFPTTPVAQDCRRTPGRQ